MDEIIRGDLLKDHVYKRISDMIVNAELMPGDRITESSIADKFGVSLTPVREALIKLHADGVIDKIPHKGFYVKQYSEQEIRDIYEVFMALQILAIEISVKKFTEEDILAQSKLVDEMETSCELGDFKNYLAANRKVHDYYINKSENQYLIDTYQSICILPIPIFYFAEEDKEVKSMRKGIKDHRGLIKCFSDKDMTGVRKIMATHYGVEDYLIQ